MTAKVIFVAGVPACGKTTLFKKIRESLFMDSKEFKQGKVRGIENGQYKMLGVFDGSTFEGTDKLSMTVISDAINYIKQLGLNRHALLCSLKEIGCLIIVFCRKRVQLLF